VPEVMMNRQILSVAGRVLIRKAETQEDNSKNSNGIDRINKCQSSATRKKKRG
jgi:hypothetical protein